ncbi:MAG: hypothetical protein JNJ63_08490 [Hyphomonadaceae bacterium]|nr:hypothetical protein [Hyphomonadaceae bacterium]
MHLWLVLAAFALAAVTPFIGALPRGGGDIVQSAEDAGDAGPRDDARER